MIIAKTYSIKAFAKINLLLLVGKKLKNSEYHSLKTITARTNLVDVITVEVEEFSNSEVDSYKESGLSLPDIAVRRNSFSWSLKVEINQALKDHLQDENIVGDLASDNNLINKALKIISESRYFNLTGVRLNIHLLKRIPIYAGLGGGSADAAAIINLISDLKNVDLNHRLEIAQQVGQDCVLCIKNNIQLSTYDGAFHNEELHSLTEGNQKKPLYCLLYKVPEGSRTKEAYQNLNRQCVISDEALFSDEQIKDLEIGLNNVKNLISLAQGKEGPTNKQPFKTINHFEDNVLSISHEIEAGMRYIYNKTPVIYGVSGSGTTIFGIFSDIESALNTAKGLKKDGYFISVDELFI